MKDYSWNPRVPEVYQIETVSRCNLRCPFCPTGVADGNTIDEQKSLIDYDLFEKIVKRDLAGSYFVELQFRGEPTLHKQLSDMITLLQKHAPFVFTGLSTHGGLLYQQRIRHAISKLDYLTISIDAAEKERYERLRVGNNFDQLIDNLKIFFGELKYLDKYPIIDLQLIEFDDIEHQIELLEKICRENYWDRYSSIRTIQDTLKPQVDTTFKLNQTRQNLCLNPWLSVSIQCDGDVVPCCMWFSKSFVYGNVNDASLEEIWNESEKVKEFREMHLSGDLKYECANCYAKSPALLHFNLYKNALRKNRV